MARKYVYLIFALVLVSFCLILIYFINDKPLAQEATAGVQIETPPFLNYITGSGIVEPVSGNIMINSSFNRLIEKVNVSVNDRVKKGDILFQQYNQDLKYNLKFKQKKYEQSLSNLYKLQSLPREEDLIIALENLNKTKAMLNASIAEYCMANRRARYKKEKNCLHLYKYQQAEADFFAAQAQYEKVRSGTWRYELKIAQDDVEQAKSEIEATEAEIERTYIKSPIDGTILQIKIHEGEISDQNKSAIILGNIDELNLRVGIDQLNAPRFRATSPAVAFKQGNTLTEFPIEFIQVEPFMVPKKYLTNELQEKVDTQIFEVIYRIKTNKSDLFVGEQMDVYIKVDETYNKES